MSRPKAWNGSQWVDPAFWTGSEWKSYIPPTYEPLAIADQQFATTQGWTVQQNGSAPVVQSGSLYLRATPSGAFDWSAWDSLTEESGLVRANAAPCYAQGRIRAVNHGTSTRTVQFRCWYSDVSVAMVMDFDVAPGQDTGYVVRTSPTRTVESEDPIRWDVVGQLYPDVEIWIDYAQLIEVSTGRVLESLGDPGWQPYVYDGRDWI